MTVLSRGARGRRGGRRPGWLLLTALLVLAIAASSALVFTNRAELLKLAVILALWAAVVAAFVSVIYRRQSDVDQARVRDLKLVYDLQLDREISARREYELTVESQLRRELASELRAQAADEVSALRAELSALRTNLEILFDTDLNHRPALETERRSVRGYSEWDRENESPRERINRVASVRAEEASRGSDDSSIIDVPEEPAPPRQDTTTAQASRGSYHYPAADTYRPPERYEPAQPYRGGRAPADQQPPAARWAPPEQPRQRSGWAPQEPPEPEPPQRARPRHGASQPQSAPVPPVSDWQPVGPEGQWLPPGTQGSNWVSGSAPHNNHMAEDSSTAGREPTLATPPPAGRPGRHSGPAESVSGPPAAAESDSQPDESGGGRSRHSAEHNAEPAAEHATPVMSSPPQPEARHRSADPSSDPDGPPTGGQSVADLLARLQASPTGGGRRRRRED